MLVLSRRAGVSFERAWPSAYARVRWPHDTEDRREWKIIIAEMSGDYEKAYHRDGPENRRIVACYSLMHAASLRAAA